MDGRLRRVVEEDREFVPEGVGDEERDYAGLGGGGGEGGEGEEPEEEDAEGVHGWVVGNECGFVLSEWNGAGGARNETGGVAWGGFIYPNLFANFFSTGYGVENSNACLGGLATVSKAFSRLRARLTRRCSCEGRRGGTTVPPEHGPNPVATRLRPWFVNATQGEISWLVLEQGNTRIVSAIFGGARVCVCVSR